MIRPGDYVLVTEAEPVYITGAVLSPGGLYLRDQLMLEPRAGNGGRRKKRGEAERREDLSSDSRICESGNNSRRRSRHQEESEARLLAAAIRRYRSD